MPSKQARLNCLMIALMMGSVSLSGCSLMQKLPLPGKPAESPGSVSTSAQSGGGAIDSKALKAHLDAGNAKAKAGQWNEAVTEFQQVVTLDPRNVQGHVQLGWAFAELKQWDEAKQHLISAVALSPDNAGAHANLAWVYAEKQRWNDAQIEAKKAIDLDPKNPYAHATLAWAYQSTGQEGLAIAEYEKSLELNPRLDNSRFALGVGYCNQGITVRAQEQLNQLIKQGSPKATDLQTRLSKGCGGKK